MKKARRKASAFSDVPLKQFWKRWWPVALLLALTFGLYQQVSDFDLINYDDNRYVTDNKDVRDLSVEGIKRMFVSPQYKEEIMPPLTILSLAINYHYSELSGGSYHITNLIFHLLNVVLVLILVYKLTNHYTLTLFVAAVFALHPSATEAVSWVAARKEVQYAFFYLLAAIFALRYWEDKKWYNYLIVLVLFVLSYYSKYAAASFPVFYIVFALMWKKRGDYKRLIAESIPLLALPFYSLWLSILGLFSGGAEEVVIGDLDVQNVESIADVAGDVGVESMYHAFGFGHKILLGGYSLIQYLLKFIFPFDQQIIYPYPELDDGGALPSEYVWYSAIALVLMLGMLYMFIKKRALLNAPLGVGLLFFSVHVILLLHVLPIGGRVIIADRYMYIPYIGLAISAFWVLESLSNRIGGAKLLHVALLLFIGLLTLQSWQRIPDWKNTKTIFTDLTEKEPAYASGYVSLGKYYYDSEQYAKAEENFIKATNLNLHSEMAHLNLGAIYILQDNTQKAIAHLEQAKKINPNTASVHFNLGHAYLKLGLHDKAIASYEKSLKYDDHGNFHHVTEYNLGKLYYSKKQYTKAAEKFRISIGRKPNNSEAYNNLGITYLHGLKKPKEALLYLERAISINPGLTVAVIQYCEALYQLEEYERLQVLSKQLTEVNPEEGIGYFYLGISMIKNDMEGCVHLERALTMNVDRALEAYQVHCR